MTIALVIQAIPKLPVLIDFVLSVRPIAQLLVWYGVKEGWYFVHSVVLFSVCGTSRNLLECMLHDGILMNQSGFGHTIGWKVKLV